MPLNTELKAFKRTVEADAPPGVLDAFRRAVMALHKSDILENALKAGEGMPGFTLPDTKGRAVSLAGLLLRGPVVVSFYRGDWCDYCWGGRPRGILCQGLVVNIQPEGPSS